MDAEVGEKLSAGNPASRMIAQREHRDYHVCLFGASLETKNMGCRALAASLIRLVLNARPNARITLIYGDQQASVKEVRLTAKRSAKVNIVNYRLSPKARLHDHLLWILFLACVHKLLPIRMLRERICESNPLLRCLKRADFVGDIRGGDSFADLYGLLRFLCGSLTGLIAILMGKDLVLLPQTYGPYRSFVARLTARFILSRARQIYSRDVQGTEVVRGLLRHKAGQKAIRFCPDVAFCLEPIPPREIRIEPPFARNGGETLVGLNVNGLLYMGGYDRNNMFGLRCDYREFVRALVGRLLDNPRCDVLLTPHTFGAAAENDQEACRDVWLAAMRRGSGRVHMVSSEYDQNEIKAIIGRCDFFIGSRMHSCIAALSQGIPSVALAYSRKFVGVFDSLGLGDMVLDARRLSQDEMLDGCVARLRKKESLAESLKRVIPEVRAQLEACFRNEIFGAAGKMRSDTVRSAQGVECCRVQ